MKPTLTKTLFAAIFIFLFLAPINAQIKIGSDLSTIDYGNPREFEIGGITVSGVQYLDNNVLIMLSGLGVGQKINVPGEEISSAIENLWKQGLFDDIQITATNIQGTIIFLDIYLKERPRLSRFSFEGVKKNEADELREELRLTRGDPVTDNMVIRTKTYVRNHFVDKGFLNCIVEVDQIRDTGAANTISLNIGVKRGKKVKIREFKISGNENLSSKKMKKLMKETKEKNFFRVFKASRFIEHDYKKDKGAIIEKYNELGFRDAVIKTDTFYSVDDKHIVVEMKIEEGKKYYFGEINWLGNTKHSSEKLNSILQIKKGDIYNQKVLETNLYMNLEGTDVSSLYLDDGYLFFNITPVEVNVENDTIDLEIRIYEGRQARINKVTVRGNTRTNDHVIIREIRTKPGQLFNRSDIIRTQRELAQLRYFDPEKLSVNPIPNQADGTVDIEYIVEETSSDQIELSGGWGVGTIVGTLGLSFNNFSTRNFFKKGAWRPLPTGDGQKLSIRAQSNGTYYQAYNASFSEPWLGGKKPNALTVSIYHSVQSNGLKKGDANRQAIKIYGVSVGLGKKLTWPDDYFMLYQDLTFQHYDLQNYYSTFSFSDGSSNNFSYSAVLSRNSIDAPIFPRRGSEFMVSLQLTPPYSLFEDKDYATLSSQEKYRWTEYHKWKFNTSWFTKLAGNLVLNTRTKFGFLGLYNTELGIAPFERFYLGGDGLSGFALDGRELIGLRGYSNNSLTPRNADGYVGGTIYNKYTVELRYPVSLNPMATIYVVGFAEAGNSWLKFSEFNPFDVKRAVGAGVRIYLPMFGLLGLDYGYGFDEIPGLAGANKGQFHFSINQSID